jgi:hypothetical protein
VVRSPLLRHHDPSLKMSLTDPQCTRGKLRVKIPQYLFLSHSFHQYLRSPHIGSFADGQLTDALKHLATDYTTDPKVRKKVLAVLASWSRQFKDDRGAAGIAGLYRQVKPAGSEGNREALAERERESEKRRKEKEEAKRKAKEKRLEEARSKKATSRTATSRKQFNFAQVCVFPLWYMPLCYVLTRILIYRRSLRS